MTKWLLKNPILTWKQQFGLIKTPKNQIQSTSLSNSCIDISISTPEKKLQVVYLKNYVSFTRGRETLFSRNFIFTTLKAKFMPSITTFFAWVTKFKPKRKVQSIEVRTQVHWLINRANSARPFGKCRVMSILDTPHDFYSLSREQKS